MHKRNLHNNRYNLKELTFNYPPLKEFVFINKHHIETLDFSNPKAVKALNTALLKKHYNINFWNFSDDNLCPPIPSRADYIHHLADLINESNKQIKVLDIGTGATCIYPLLGNSIYKWSFIGTDIDNQSLENASNIVKINNLDDVINFRFQKDKNQLLKGVIKSGDYFNLTMCNPPFYKSKEEAIKANNEKTINLKLNTDSRNFSGNANELWYNGGEKAFLHNYLFESTQFKKQVGWFTSLVSKKSLLTDLKKSAIKLNIPVFIVVEMQQGNKKSRFIAWRF